MDWGIVVNEALCFGLPVIVSDQVGAGLDMVKHGKNGFSFPRGDVDELAASIKRIMELTEDERAKMGTNSRGIIENWLKRDLAESLGQYVNTIRGRRNQREK